MKSVTIYATAASGVVRGTDANYATARSTATEFSQAELIVGQGLYTGAYTVNRIFLKFDTSVLPPSAIVTKVRLRLGIYSVASSEVFDIQVVEQDWSEQDPLSAIDADIETAYDGCLAGDLASVVFTAPAITSRPGGHYVAYSDDLDIERVDIDGSTYYSLRSSLDYDGEQPALIDYCNLAPTDYFLEFYRPALVIDYIDEPQYDFLGWQLYIDWVGDGAVESWQDEAGRVLRFALDRGRDRTIGAPGGGFESPHVGKLILEMDNSDGRFDPWNKDSPLYGQIQPGRRVNFAVWHNGKHYTLFTGYIADLRPVGYRQPVNLIIEDGAGWLNADTPDIPLIESAGVDAAIDAILDDLAYPFGRTIEAGLNEQTYYWTSGKNGLSEIHMLANSDMGRFCVDADGTAHFRNRHNNDTVSRILTEDQLGRNIYFPMPWEYSRSIVDAWIYPRQVGPTDSTLFTLRTAPTIPPGETLTLWCKYRYNDQDVPAVDVYLSSWQPSTDFTGDDISVTVFSRDARIDITNNTEDAQILTELIIKGTPIYSPEPIKIQKSDKAVSELNAAFVYDYPWATDINIVQDFARVLLDYLNDPKEYPEITLYNRPEIGCAIDLEERLRLVLDTFDIDKTFFVHKVSHRSGASMQEIITTAKLSPMLQAQDENVALWDYGLWDVNDWGF